MTPEQAKENLNVNNYWAETGLTAKFLFVDGLFGLILMVATLNLFSTTTWIILGVSFAFFAILAKFDLSVSEFGHIVWAVLCKKKYRRY
ncbi:hypothetical protein [Vibrio sp. D431a]|uniref:hypothetical protein n=1 Tax=Vibrio sp. D431a TaxID=2837388 RepID=UPI00255522B3|nr:hypothetical protein [Vibrio sp. D431a]MDK9793840.1 hypothetical protein [Vibrio sp. D431a]